LKQNGCPLALAPTNLPMTVVAVNGGSGLRQRLTDMGIIAGTQIVLVNSRTTGPVIVDVKGSRLALGRGVAHHILVDPEKPARQD